MDHSKKWTTGSRFFPDFCLFPAAPPAPIRFTQKALRPLAGRSAFTLFICLEKLGLNIPHLEGADDAAVLALGDT